MNLEPKKPQQDVVFRRIRGRIIPIRRALQKKDKSDLTAGAALVAAGAAVSLGAGEAAARLVQAAAAKRVKAKFDFNRVYRGFKRSGEAAQGAFNFMGPGRARMGAAAEAAVGTRRTAFRLFKARNIALAVGTIGGAALITLGLNRVNKALNDNKTSDTQELATNIAGSIAAAAATTFYYRRLGLVSPALLKAFSAAKTAGKARPFNLPISFSKGGPFGKGGTFRFRG